ncbi:cation:proton antiporter [Roseinatronobacter bogoriensis]|uniref:Sodium:proton antiporter n=1 Tax=Roseinatronobacter bogoriensis subsp. barguzinensis TaxID=441209 RepID=A0A2K8K5Z9_9RHOB|nr:MULTISPECIES: cation:proton antiporter [Rhodobaca]ATX64882.1 sodium:proton antiporter [Rhodobaca barguzinensis]MBB4208683.1 CPA1 family monovalent cation:H+ antiporter [Rhodobaca bogoriensis DSM 18756]TDW38049.1 sodium/proton antiporter (CPA1 family) [Rhodobaca barguzinensis]TDY69781.1 sodium/proton antiporter (CPA1 family) [Rhodobaca bogoriensis DSM 18756]
MDIIALVGALAVLFIVIGISEPLSERLRLPFTVILAIVGAIIGALALYVLSSDVASALNPVMRRFLEIPIRSNVFLYVLLPTLLFQVALMVNARRMLDDWVPILVMAVGAVIVATVVIGYALSPFTTLSFAACLLIGAIVSTTDPSAVVSIFRNIAAPQRLTRIVEGESLLNDAAAIALFGFFLTFVMSGVPDPSLQDALVIFPWLVLGGIGLGLILARATVALMALIPTFPRAQVSISVALPYLTYIIAEQFLATSGVIAVVVAGLTLNLTGPGRLTPMSWTYLREVWEVLAYWAGALIFILAALLIPRLMGDLRLSDLFLICIIILAAFVARAIMLWGMLPALSFMRLSPQVEPAYRVGIMWGGLRGAVTLALALAVTENALVPPAIKREVGILATGFTLFTLLVQGTTLRWVIARLGLDRLPRLDQALSHQVIAVALQNVREEIAETARDFKLPQEVIRSEAKRFAERLDSAVELAEEAEAIPDRDRITLGLVALAGRERDLIIENFRQQLFSARLVDRMLSDVDRLIEQTRGGGRNEYRAAGRRALGYGGWYRLAVVLHNRLRWSLPLERMTAERFELLLNQRLILGELHGYIHGKIRRIHGRRVAELLHELLRRREEETDNAIEGLRLQYPGYAEEMERRFIRRASIRLEEREYETLFGDGLISRELYTTLRNRLTDRRTKVEARPALDFALQKDAFLRSFPLFEGMREDQRRQLARALRTHHIEPGTVLLRKGEVPHCVYFIASGAVEMERKGQKLRLGSGEFFGHIGLLTREPRRAMISAISHCTLLSLDETRFKRLLARNRSLYDAVLHSAELRGVTLDSVKLSDPPAKQTTR